MEQRSNSNDFSHDFGTSGFKIGPYSKFRVKYKVVLEKFPWPSWTGEFVDVIPLPSSPDALMIHGLVHGRVIIPVATLDKNYR